MIEHNNYNYDIIINGEKFFTIYNIHMYDKDYTEEINEFFYKIKIDIFNELVKKQLFLDVINSLIKIYKNNFDFLISTYFKFYIKYINKGEIEEIEEIKKLLLVNLLFDVIIKFDEIKIINSSQNEADLKDFFVKFKILFNYDINNNLLCKLNHRNLYGMRSTRYDFELNTGYIHSHLPRSYDFTDFENFCLGTGPISLVLIELSNNIKPFNIIKFKGFLYQIKSYLEWESLEGGPYIKITDRNNIHSQIVNKFCFNIDVYSAHVFLIKKLFALFTKTLIYNNLINITLKKNFTKDINDIIIEMSLEKELEFIKIIKDDNFLSKYLNEKELEIFKSFNEYLFAIKRNNIYYKTSLLNINLSIDNELNNKYLFDFKDEKVNSKILELESKNLDSIEVLNPNIKKRLLLIIKNIILKNERKTNNEKSQNYRIKSYKDTSIYI